MATGDAPVLEALIDINAVSLARAELDPATLLLVRIAALAAVDAPAASYLMHSNNFSQVREFLLTHSKLILQDDSGIPFRFFAPDKWNRRHVGHYIGPINRFLEHGQMDLNKENAASAPPPLEFSFGYQWQPSRSSLMIATPKE